MLIGLTASNAAGKDEVAGYLVRKHGFTFFSLSDVLRAELIAHGVPVTRENLIETGNALRLERGPGVLAEKALQSLKNIRKAVVVSIRNTAEIEVLRNSGEDFLLLGLDAPLEVRYQRARRRGRTDDALTLEDFIRQDKKERKGDENEQQLDSCFSLCDRVINNDGTLEELYEKVEEIL